MLMQSKGPYGKDTSYAEFADFSWKQVNPKHKSGDHSAWETPDPTFWTNAGYAVVRADERGLGQSPGKLDTMSRDTSEVCFLYSSLQPTPADQMRRSLMSLSGLQNNPGHLERWAFSASHTMQDPNGEWRLGNRKVSLQ